MPELDGKKYSYTQEGKKEYKEDLEKKKVSSVKDMKKKKKSKSFMQKLFNKLKIKRGGRGMGGEMPLTNLDVKKLGSRRSKLR